MSADPAAKPGRSQPKPPVFRSVGQAYADARAALSAMPDMLLVGLVLSCVYAAADIALGWLFDSKAGFSMPAFLLSTLTGQAWNFALTPVFIAIHRYIILNEVTERYRLDTREPRFIAFFGWTVILTLAGSVPVLLGRQAGAGTLAGTLVMAVMLFVFVISVRLIILFPAIAVDAPGRQWQNAYADSRGSFWRILGIEIVALLPLLVVALLAVAALGEESGVLKAVLTVAAFFGAVLSVAIASRLYQALALRLRGPAAI